jgi:hypothetical protein
VCGLSIFVPLVVWVLCFAGLAESDVRVEGVCWIFVIVGE